MNDIRLPWVSREAYALPEQVGAATRERPGPRQEETAPMPQNPTSGTGVQRPHVTRDFRGLSRQGGRGLEFVDDFEDCPTTNSAHDISEGATWPTPNGWYRREGEYWAPIYPPHEPGAVDALSPALPGNLPCKPCSYGSGCAGVDPDVPQIIDDLREAGWRLTRDPGHLG